MSLATITKGVTRKPPRLLIYGTEGIGKSTFAASAPSPIFIQTEDGLDTIDCAKFPLSHTVAEVDIAIKTLYTEKHDFKTVVLDSADWLEKMIWNDLCEKHQKKSIASFGFQEGYSLAAKLFSDILDKLNRLRTEKGMGVILIAHSKIERIDDPEHGQFDRHSPRLHTGKGSTTNAILIEWVDAVLFAHRQMTVRKTEESFGRESKVAVPVGADGGDRLLRTVGSPSCVAKNRFGMDEILPLSWPAVAKFFGNGKAVSTVKKES